MNQKTPKPCIGFHNVKDRDITIEAKSYGQNWWLEVNIGDTEVTIYAASKADFDAMCHRFSVITDEEAEAHYRSHLSNESGTCEQY